MGRINIGQYQAYQEARANNEGGERTPVKFYPYFSLKKSNETARVRVLSATVEDVDAYFIHKVPCENKKGVKYWKEVNCLNDDGRHVDDCPFCKEYNHLKGEDGKSDSRHRHAKAFLKLINLNTNQYEYFERGMGWVKDELSPYAKRNLPLYGKVIEIERIGSDLQTTYKLYACDSDENGTPYPPVIKEDIEVLKVQYEVPEILGTTLVDASADQMNCYIEQGFLPFNSIPSATASPSTAVPPEPAKQPIAAQPLEKSVEPPVKEQVAPPAPEQTKVQPRHRPSPKVDF